MGQGWSFICARYTGVRGAEPPGSGCGRHINHHPGRTAANMNVEEHLHLGFKYPFRLPAEPVTRDLCYLMEAGEDSCHVLPCNNSPPRDGFAHRVMFFFCRRERQEQLMGYRKRGPKPKHLLIQVGIQLSLDHHSHVVMNVFPT